MRELNLRKLYDINAECFKNFNNGSFVKELSLPFKRNRVTVNNMDS